MKKRSSNKKNFAVIRQKPADKNRCLFHPTIYLGILCGASLIGLAVYLTFDGTPKISAEDNRSDYEKAIYTKQEFFGQQAFVPLPTHQVRENLNALLTNRPDDWQILEKLSEANEKLEKFDEAEANLKRLAEIDISKNELLTAFYDRRGAYQKEAETLKKIFDVSKPEERPAIFERLIDLARRHDLRQYLNADFYAQVIEKNSGAFLVFEKLIEKLYEEKDYKLALEFVRTAKSQFPGKQNFLLGKEIEILLSTNQKAEAEKVYQAAFDPFWSEEDAQKFYDFLSEQDKLRAYGGELQARFKKNPADFEAAIRLALYLDHDYSYGSEQITPIILKLEQAKKSWTLNELVTVTRLLLRRNEGATASRFLYTLFLRREDFQNNPELRAKVLYQLFEMFSDAENENLPISKGDLRFYKDVARSDTDPGIATGILSLIFSDSNPQQKLDEKEKIADRHFNRAAAYRIFEEYKKEVGANSTNHELGQMHLDLVRLYAATGETDFAGKLLDEFAERVANSSEYPPVAIKLAAAFTAAGREEKARETYQKVLDYLGKQPGSLAPQASVQEMNDRSSDGSSMKTEKSLINSSNDGIRIPKLTVEGNNSFDADIERAGNFQDYLTRKNPAISYAEVLEKLVASFAAEKKTAEILAVYSNEIQKHPAEEWLYEKRLEWLEQTNLTEEKLRFYKTALARFRSNNWQDKLARFFVREKRREEFVALSEDLIGKLKDREVADYLSEFAGTYFSPNDWDGRLSLQLYKSAHERFPHNINFVEGLLRIYKSNRQETEWRSLAAKYYFESAQIRKVFLDDLAEKNELRNYLQNAQGKEEIIYKLFRADASARLSDFENAVEAYRTLNELYPHTTEFSERLISFTRSFGQRDPKFLNEAFSAAKSAADFQNSSNQYRTRSGEVSAEIGDYKTARDEWEKLIQQGTGSRQNYLDAATIYWDYFQYRDALRTIENARTKFSAPTLYAFEAGTILEAEHKNEEAIREYVKALDTNDGDKEEQKEKAKKHLAKLVLAPQKQSNQSPENDGSRTAGRIEKAFKNEKSKRKDFSFLALAYAEFLVKIRRPERAAQILNRAVSQSGDEGFLKEAGDFYQTNEMANGEQIVLRKLAAAAETARKKIQYSLRLARSFEKNKEREAAKNILLFLNENFPANYGVITETSDVYRRLGFDAEAIRVLKNALPVSRGFYRQAIARKLSKQLIRLDKLDEAEKILTEIYEENPADLDIFNQLAEIYVRRQDGANLRKTFAAALKSLKESETEKREIAGQIAEFRRRMINAFTQLKDYKSATEQYIEIINRNPEDEEITEQAIRYVKRYGGAEMLLNYYQKTAAQSFKNYRWNVVLARIYLANNDAENALKNYQTAVINQPEMPELYLAIAEIETKRNNFNAALKNLDEVLELSGNAPKYVKKKIEILKKAGRFSEIEAEKAKLPAEDRKKIKTNEFAEAQNLANIEREKSLAVFRQAFTNLLENPLSGDLKTADLTAYVQTVRTVESLAEMNRRMWSLREKLTAIATANDSVNAGEARKRLEILDTAIVEAVGTIAKTVATDEELAVLHTDLNKKIENAPTNSDGHQLLSLVQNLSRRAGFGDLEEKILLKKLETAIDAADGQTRLQNLVISYKERGAYQKNFDLVQKYANNNFSLLAETARLAGNRQKEIEALRAVYHQSSQPENEAWVKANNENIQRYLEILYRENRSELESLTKKSSVYQLQLINFLLGKGEKVLSHQAIENSDFSDAWKVSRGAEISLALREFDQSAECYFCEALQFAPIGEMIAASPDKTSFLINDDWFRLTREYGEWLKYKSSLDADDYLAAMTENQPKNADEQLKLGEFYLEQKEYQKAISHLNLAIETENLSAPDKKKAAVLGAALYLSNEQAQAEKLWSQIFENVNEEEEISVAILYFQTLQKYNLGEEARKPLPPLIVRFLAKSDAERSEEFQNLIRLVASSFTDETAKAKYFMQILENRPTDISLAAMLIKENLVAAANADFFYERLIERNSFDSYSYEFAGIKQRVWSRDDAEIIYDQENNYEEDESRDDEDIENWNGEAWRKKYLRLLTTRGENLRAGKFIEKLEKEIGNDFSRPAWLRLEKIRLQIRAGKFEFTTLEKFIGIRLPASATEIKPPNIERFNEVLKLLKEENRADLISPISEAFYARNLALGEFDAANFTKLARIYFERGETAKALNVLRLLIEINDSEMRDSALAEIAMLEAIKNNSASEVVKISTDETNQSIDLAMALSSAAETAFEFGQNDSAINFRRRLAELSPEDSENKIALAKLLLTDSAGKTEGIKILHEISNDRNALRVNRWQARMILSEHAEFSFSDIADYDALAQFYQGKIAMQKNQTDQAIGFFVQSLIDDKDIEINAREELIKAYALAGNSFAAVRFAGSNESEKSDELLQIVSDAAEQIGDFQNAIQYEKSKSNGGDKEKIARLEKLSAEKNGRVTDLIVDKENTRKL